MRPRFLADANLKRAIRRGVDRVEPAVDFLSAESASLRGMPDPEVLSLAGREGRILVSHDLKSMPRHYRDFLSSGQRSSGVFLIAQDVPVVVAIDALMLIWVASEAEEWADRFYLPL